jgi:hypothetical protein
MSACQGISKPPKGTPRLELEVAVRLDESYTSKIGRLDEALTRRVEEAVLSRADLGLRFYPVLARQYTSGSHHPEYLMTVEVRALGYDIDHRTVKPAEGDPVIESFVREVRCSVATTIEKRRQGAPALTVGRVEQTGSADCERNPPPQAARYALEREVGTEPALEVTADDLVRAIDRALNRAMSALVGPVDRELALVVGPVPEQQR